jgi:ectoine hydroxylase-related dioxygenase (phytanoyl-CoA dioxygenase family)
MKFLYERESLPPEQRNNHGGPSQVMLDHPVLVGILNEILSHQPVATEDCYGFRYDHTYTSHRKPGSDTFNPHGGGGFFNFNGNSHVYQAQRGQVHSGLTRCVWELNPVRHGKGGTLVLSGSHKAAFPLPKSFRERDCKAFETYECPAGSVLVFTESLCHTGTMWTDTEHDRLALFTCYNTVGAKWGGPNQGAIPPEVVASFPPKRQTLFRGVWTGMPPNKGLNTYYDEKNYAV